MSPSPPSDLTPPRTGVLARHVAVAAVLSVALGLCWGGGVLPDLPSLLVAVGGTAALSAGSCGLRGSLQALEGRESPAPEADRFALASVTVVALGLLASGVGVAQLVDGLGAPVMLRGAVAVLLITALWGLALGMPLARLAPDDGR